MARIRKALIAAGTAGLGALLLGLKTEVPTTEEGWVALIAGAVGIGLAAGFATWRVPNAPPTPVADARKTFARRIAPRPR